MGWVRVVVALLAASLASGCATQLGQFGGDPGRAPAMPVAALPDSAIPAPVPAGYISFCLRFSSQCETAPGTPASVALTDETWRTLNRINRQVNDAIWPEDDELHYGRAEYWTIPTDGYGDCDDYAVTKRKELIDAGFPAPALRLAVVDTPRAARHAVLTVATDKGDYVLDSLNNEIVPWNVTGFTWIERQDPLRPLGWVSLLPAASPTLTSTASQPTAGDILPLH